MFDIDFISEVFSLPGLKDRRDSVSKETCTVIFAISTANRSGFQSPSGLFCRLFQVLLLQVFYFFLWYNPGDIRTLVNWRNNVDISTSFSLSLSMLTSNVDNSTENPLQNNIGREKDRTVLPKLSILDCWSPGSFILSWFQKLLAFWLAQRLLWLRKSTITKTQQSLSKGLDLRTREITLMT